jgi:hypothetical protein
VTTEQRAAAALDLRQREGLSLREIGKRLGVSHATVATYLEATRPKCGGCGLHLLEPVDDDRCGFCREEALADLAAPAPVGTFAIWDLREAGHSAAAVVAAAREARRGAPVEDVAAMLGAAA